MAKQLRMNPVPAEFSGDQLDGWLYLEYKRMIRKASSPTTRRKYERLRAQLDAKIRKSYGLPEAA